ncbi:MAG: sigma 54-interacting transcriptional regulator [Planctomycetota bacterium]|nr:sigma 54-interacting transcriptional regulator [Planctomycetota bacterium]
MKSRPETELEVFYGISRAVAREHRDIAALLNDILDVMEKKMFLERGTLTLRRPAPEAEIFEIVASRGLSAEEKKRGQYRLGEGITGKVAQTGKPALVPDITQEKEFLNRTGARRGQRVAFLCAPIIHNRQVIGTFSIDRPLAPRHELECDLHFLTLVAGLIAEAVATIRAETVARENLLAENRLLRQTLQEQYRPANLVGNSSGMRLVYEQIAQVAESNATVLVRGESGTGKELVARAIHFSSPRRDRPFVAVNCAALPENLIESELFGHEKGAFTGAVQQRRGRFEQADGGTLFLDEIGDIPASVQVRLLRVLQEREFERIGGEKTLRVDVRIIAATNTNLEEALKNRKFREDLYYRLNVFPIFLPPLRERKSDIVLLAEHFAAKYGKRYGKEIVRLSQEAISLMVAYSWPGNVRELENCLERAVLTSRGGVINASDLPPSLQRGAEEAPPPAPNSAEGSSLQEMVEAFERSIITDALKKHRGRIAAAARALKTTERILGYRIQRMGINPRAYR